MPTGLRWPEETVYHCMPILVYADFTWPFKLHTDASGSHLGAVLYQTCEDGTDAVIAYASRSLSKAESHYPAHKLEFLTLKWAEVEKFQEYLYGLNFDIYTDNNPLTYMLTTAKLDAASPLLGCQLGMNYNFQLYYWAGKTNIWCRCLVEGVLARMHAWELRYIISRSQLQWYELCKRLSSKVLQVSLRLTAVICTFWMQSRTVSRSPVWPWKTGIRPSKQILL